MELVHTLLEILAVAQITIQLGMRDKTVQEINKTQDCHKIQELSIR
jgi:hypothetical protein